MTTTESPDDDWLQDSWTVYAHASCDPTWTLDSYHRLGQVATLADFWPVHLATRSRLLDDVMVFFMREHVFPCWDDASNIDGGCISFKVSVNAARAFWDELVKRALGETLVASDADTPPTVVVNGVSSSGRRGGFCIFKVWVGGGAGGPGAASSLRIPYDGEVVYRSNRELITVDQNREKPPAAAAAGGRGSCAKILTPLCTNGTERSSPRRGVRPDLPAALQAQQPSEGVEGVQGGARLNDLAVQRRRRGG